MPTRIKWKGGGFSSQSDSSSDQYSEHCTRSSYDSDRTNGTAQTASSTWRPAIKRHDTSFGRIENHDPDYRRMYEEPRTSCETYASTIQSDEDEDEDDDEPPFDLVDCPDEDRRSDAIPATPRDFADLFPSSRQLLIRHDDSTADGNMNLRVDTEVHSEWTRHTQILTLFHLKMKDLRRREFSLRRYCRGSGREVCHTVRKSSSTYKQVPFLARPFNSARSTRRRSPNGSDRVVPCLQRHDSGYESMTQGDMDQVDLMESEAEEMSSSSTSNTVKLDFSNYAQVEVTSRGLGEKRRHHFEYWGHTYTWKRGIDVHGNLERTLLHLYRNDGPGALAHIVSVPLTRDQAREERLKGGWVPPCSMWIDSEEVIDGPADVADVIIASGLIALVDDAIRRRWHSTGHRQVLMPLYGMNREHMGPRRLMDEIFNRHPHV